MAQNINLMEGTFQWNI